MPATNTIVQPILRLGSTGEEVREMQQILNATGHGYLILDGIFGPLTEEAVKRFQQTYNLTIDGIVGEVTWTILLEIDFREGGH